MAEPLQQMEHEEEEHHQVVPEELSFPSHHEYLQVQAVVCCCCLLFTAVSSEAWAKLRDWASVAGRGWLLLSGSVAHASLNTAVQGDHSQQ